MDLVEREARVGSLFIELGLHAADLAEQAGNLQAAIDAGDPEGALEAADIIACTHQQLAAARMSIRVLRVRPEVGQERAST
jgi:hypothetical protein